MGYVAAFFIGITLGLIGGGGSILTVPVLVYLFGVSPLISTSYSLFIVGTTSLIGTIANYRKKLVDVKTGLLFTATSAITVFIIRKFILPFLPQVIHLGKISIQLSTITMILFAVVMLAAAISMLYTKAIVRKNITAQNKLSKMLIYGTGIGMVTGFLGAGGGFLLIPVFVIALCLPVRIAIGTSLFVIMLNSVVGFAGDIGTLPINWKLLLIITSIAIAGILIGGQLNGLVKAEKLKKGFGVFVLLMGLYIIIRETILQ